MGDGSELREKKKPRVVTASARQGLYRGCFNLMPKTTRASLTNTDEGSLGAQTPPGLDKGRHGEKREHPLSESGRANQQGADGGPICGVQYRPKQKGTVSKKREKFKHKKRGGGLRGKGKGDLAAEKKKKSLSVGICSTAHTGGAPSGRNHGLKRQE